MQKTNQPSHRGCHSGRRLRENYPALPKKNKLSRMSRCILAWTKGDLSESRFFCTALTTSRLEKKNNFVQTDLTYPWDCDNVVHKKSLIAEGKIRENRLPSFVAKFFCICLSEPIQDSFSKKSNRPAPLPKNLPHNVDGHFLPVERRKKTPIAHRNAASSANSHSDPILWSELVNELCRSELKHGMLTDARGGGGPWLNSRTRLWSAIKCPGVDRSSNSFDS